MAARDRPIPMRRPGNSTAVPRPAHAFRVSATLFLTVLATRVPFSSRLLFSLDSVQFALALKRYDVPTHQPHPPGYFLYVMLGKLADALSGNANRGFVSLSIVFSGLLIVFLFLLGAELYDRRTGILAALIGITSPSVWFQGEVALTYIVGGCFAALIALLCAKIMNGKPKWLFFSALAMGIAGGFRQDTPVFLFPLWLYAVKDLPPRKIAISAGLMILASAAWFAPMLRMTGGWDAYWGAFRELWRFNTGGVSVFAQGWRAFAFYSRTVARFTLYGIGVGIFPLALAGYASARRRKGNRSWGRRGLFLALWTAPSILFYLFVFVQPANPGYAMVFLPALCIAIARSVEFLDVDLQRFWRRSLFLPIVSFVVLGNAALFLWTASPASYAEIRGHDADLSRIIKAVATFPPDSTAVVVAKPYVFYGFRHIMYYLPDYRVYQIDVRIAPTGERRKTFWGMHRETFRTDGIELPKGIRRVAVLTDTGSCERLCREKGAVVEAVTSDFLIVSIPVERLGSAFPRERFSSSTEDAGVLPWI